MCTKLCSSSQLLLSEECTQPTMATQLQLRQQHPNTAVGAPSFLAATVRSVVSISLPLSLSSLCICLSVLQTAESQSTCARKQRTSDRTSALSQALLLLVLVLVCSVRLSLAWLPLRWRTLRHRQKTGGQQPSTFTHSLSGRSTRSSSLAQINASFLCLSPSFQLSVC